MYEHYSNAQKFLCESCKTHLSFDLFLYLLIFMNSASQIVQLTFFQTFLVLPKSCLSSNLTFSLECAFSLSLSCKILLILWGMDQVSSSRRHAMFMSFHKGIYVISLSHHSNPKRSDYYAFCNRWKYETLKKMRIVQTYYQNLGMNSGFLDTTSSFLRSCLVSFVIITAIITLGFFS